MDIFEKMKEYGLSEIIELAKKDKEGLDNLCLYTKKYAALATADLTCYLESYPEINADDKEEYPEFVRLNSLELFFYGQQFADVMSSLESQKELPVIDDYINAINYYLGNDNFITL